MRVIRHNARYLVRMSYPEMEAMNEIVERGLDALDELDANPLSLAARKAMGRWRGNPLKQLWSPAEDVRK
jgi:hypothetical protein